ncbi:MAG: bifunctional phosphoribosyl-AMP cyclohydrolase/phosphoribosyl-ATP diphosphatase HisIE [Oscillospiraceae bacterium]|jgi:phosphoribosyl-ATP pyrophosphohydrolase/phosphoribosyl-AMP cyclohydrolase|nr:bifunctional phosphoribosyl-AMP cyclohydrolase/phosphoribosyl-ATP diphosphatase HisIE [Oscillospiraceae bacterium]
MLSIDELKFDENGLIPAVVADAGTGDVLTLAYMSRESLKISMDEGRTCFWSRSRGELWRKGETSGNVQHIVGIAADCDRDALAVYVNKDGPACHTGAQSCFNEYLYGERASGFSLSSLFELISERRRDRKDGSYTTYLFDKGIDKILKKIGEESTEVVIAGKAADRGETVYELADLAYHCLVLMAELGLTPDDVRRELESRHVIDKKIKQEKMT